MALRSALARGGLSLFSIEGVISRKVPDTKPNESSTWKAKSRNSVSGKWEGATVTSLGLEHGSGGREDSGDLFRVYGPTVLSYVVHRGARAADAEDVVSETFLVCFRRISQVPDDSLPWLLSVAHKVLANQLRAQARRNALGQKLFEAAPIASRVDGGGCLAPVTSVLDAYRDLPVADRAVLELTVLRGLNYEETAKALGLTRKAVYGRHARALTRLKGLLPAPPI